MSQTENNIPYQFNINNQMNTNNLDWMDFTIKKTDSCDNIFNFGNTPQAALTQNKSIFANNLNGKAHAQNELNQFPWLNQPVEQENNNNFMSAFNETNFGLNYVSSFPAVFENRKHEHNDDYDFMNLNSDDNHYDNISNHFNDFENFQKPNNVDEFEQYKTNQSLQYIKQQECLQQQNQFIFENQIQQPQIQKVNIYQYNETQKSYNEANPLKMDDFNEIPHEMIIEPYSEEEQRQIREENERRENEGLNKISEGERFGGKYKNAINGLLNNQKRRDYDKNICRYIARQMMRCFTQEDYKEIVLKRFCSNSEELYEKIVSYIKKSIPSISGHRAFKDLLAIRKEEESDIKDQKLIFRRYAKWFLRERSLRYIMLGNSEDKTQYIRFKNQVMLYFIDKPEKWNANLKINPQPFKVRNQSYNQYQNQMFQDATSSSQEQF